MSASTAADTIFVESSGFWSVAVNCGEELIVRPGYHLRLTNVSVGATIQHTYRRNMLLLSFNPGGWDQPLSLVVGSLIAGMLDNMTCDLILEAGQKYAFEAIGGNSFDLIGEFLDLDEDEEGVEQTILERRPRLRKISTKADNNTHTSSSSKKASRARAHSPEVDNEGRKVKLKKPPQNRVKKH